jgi:hypothetical protein
MQIHTTLSLGRRISFSYSSTSEIQNTAANFESRNSLGINEIPPELINTVVEKLLTETRVCRPVISSGINKNCFSTGRALLLYQSKGPAVMLTVVIMEARHYYQFHTKMYPILF